MVRLILILMGAYACEDGQTRSGVSTERVCLEKSESGECLSYSSLNGGAGGGSTMCVGISSLEVINETTFKVNGELVSVEDIVGVKPEKSEILRMQLSRLFLAPSIDPKKAKEILDQNNGHVNCSLICRSCLSGDGSQIPGETLLSRINSAKRIFQCECNPDGTAVEPPSDNQGSNPVLEAPSTAKDDKSSCEGALPIASPIFAKKGSFSPSGGTPSGGTPVAVGGSSIDSDWRFRFMIGESGHGNKFDLSKIRFLVIRSSSQNRKGGGSGGGSGGDSGGGSSVSGSGYSEDHSSGGSPVAGDQGGGSPFGGGSPLGGFGGKRDRYQGTEMDVTVDLSGDSHTAGNEFPSGGRTKIFDVSTCSPEQQQAQFDAKETLCKEQANWKDQSQKSSCQEEQDIIDKVFYYQADRFCLTNHGRGYSSSGELPLQTHRCEYNTGCDPKPFPRQTFTLKFRSGDLPKFKEDQTSKPFRVMVGASCLYVKPTGSADVADNCEKLKAENFPGDTLGLQENFCKLMKAKPWGTALFRKKCQNKADEQFRMKIFRNKDGVQVLSISPDQGSKRNWCLSRAPDNWADWHGTAFVKCDQSHEWQHFLDEGEVGK